MMQCLHWVRPYAVRAKTRLEKIPALLVLCGLLASSSVVPAATLSVDYDYLWPGTNNLSTEGTLDWGHWGLVNEFSYNHKHGVAQQITYSFITDVADWPDWDGPFVFDYRYGNMPDFSWTDGMPCRAIEDTWNAISIYGDRLQPDNNPTGFRIQCAADKSPKKLRIYLWGGGGKETSFTASLNGAAKYTHVWSDGDAEDRVYTLDFQADSAGETLTVEFTCSDHWWYLTLMAATLAGTNSPPAVAVTAPPDGAVFSAPATFALTASATDADGAVTNLSLFRGSTLLRQSASGALSVTLSNQPPGAYDFLAVATDNAGLSMTSFPVRVYVTTSGGTLMGSVDSTPPSVDLTAEGITDWAHWGLSSPSSFDHKAAVAQRIPNVVLLNASTPDLNNYTNYTGNVITYSWSDGTPTSGADSPTGIFLYTTNNSPAGFQLTVPATNYQRRLKLYVGLSYAHGKLDAWLSDFSTLPYSDASLSEPDNDGNAVYTLTFASANPGANLVVTWTPVEGFNSFYANLNWQAATLGEGPALAPIADRTINVGTVLTITNTAIAPTPIPLTFSLAPGAAANASVTPDTGLFTWTPTPAQIGTNTFSIVVTDSGSPPISATQSFNVTVVGSNTPPVLAAVSNRTNAVGMTLTFTNVATDSDLPAQALTFSLGSGATTNASINATNGLFTWTPITAQIGTNAFSIVVTDSGLPPLSATQIFSVTVVGTNSVPRPLLTIVAVPAVPHWGLSFRAEAGVNYTVQFTNDLGKGLGSTNWPTLTNFVGTGADVLVTDPGFSDARRFYRVLMQ